MIRAVGHGGAHRALEAVDGVGEPGDREVGDEADLGADEQLLGPEVLGAEVDEACDVGLALMAARICSSTLVVGRLADQQALHLDGEDRSR